MKKLVVLFCLISLGMFSQKPPEQGDYVARGRVADIGGHYVFKESKMVYFDFNDSLSYKWEYAYKQDAKLVSSYFKKLDKANLASIKSVDEKTIDPNLIQNYNVIEYKKGNQLIRVCWDTSIASKENEILNTLNASLDGFW
jgi:hypothetical protein